MNIVILDDDRTSLLLLKTYVGTLHGCQPVTFTRPADSLEWCIKHNPDLVIVDYLMPEMNGVEFTRQFRSMAGNSDIPVVMVTGSDERELRHHALATGINDFLTKPVDHIELTTRMRNMLALRASQKGLAERAELLAERERETLLCLGRAAQRRDPETHEHIIRVSHYSRLIAVGMGLAEPQTELLLLASPLHDVGKLGVPDRILHKPGPLTPAEYELMKQHTTIGAEILGQSNSPILQSGAEIALTHHERMDGSGYPNGLTGENIPLFGRIVAVADAFDALTSARPYKEAWRVDTAIAYIRERSGSHFDRVCVDAFLGRLDEVKAIKAQHPDPTVHSDVSAAQA
jgi:putative two-component system response regulator